jgi:hypothetical protein
MNSFFKDVIAKLITADESFSGHSSFKIADPTAVGENPVREVSLDAVPLDNGNSMLTLSWTGSAEKILEKTASSEEINHSFQLISTDMAQIVELTSAEKYDDAKNAMKEVMKTYTDDTDAPVATNMPKLNTTQASTEKAAEFPGGPCAGCGKELPTVWGTTFCKECADKGRDSEYFKAKEMTEASQDKNLWKQAKITMQNLWFSTPDELLQYQEKMKGKQTPNQDAIPLWDQEGKKNPNSKGDLVPPSMSYEDVEEDKEKEHQNIEKQIDEKIKTELESALLEKAASVFGPADVELVKSLRAPGIGRNWDEIKKIFVKDLNRDKEATTIFLDEQRKLSGDEGVEVKVEEEKPESLTPPTDLVSPQTHDKLLKDHEDKKSNPPVEEVKEKVEEKPILDESSKKCPHCSKDIWDESTVDQRLNKCWDCGMRFDNPDSSDDVEATFTPQDIMAISELDEIARADNSDIRKVASESYKGYIIVEKDGIFQVKSKHVTIKGFDSESSAKAWIDKDEPAKKEAAYKSFEVQSEGARNTVSFETSAEANKYAKELRSQGYDAKVINHSDIDQDIDASLKVKADDLNPLQEPIKEDVTMETPKQDVVPMGKSNGDHKAPSAGDWVMVKSDLKDELPAIKAKFISDYMSNDGTQWATVETPDQDLLEVEMYRVTKITDSKPAAQEADPLATPEIEIPQEAPVPITPSTEKLTSMSSDAHEHTCPKCGDAWKCHKGQACNEGKSALCGKDYAKKEFGDKKSNLKQADEASDERRYEIGMNLLDKKLMRGDIHQEEYDALVEKMRKEIFPNEAPYKELLSIKAEAEQLLKEVQSMGKVSYLFVKKGLEKHADDSAFEGNGWCRVWIQEDEVASDSRYPEILKLPDENAKIVALKDLARTMAHEALRLADSAGAKVGVQSWFDSLSPSDHDRIDWVALASPQVAESSLETKADASDDYVNSLPSRKPELPAEHICEQCKKPMGYQGFINPVCPSCVRKNHKKVTGSDFEKGISQNKTSEMSCEKCGDPISEGLRCPHCSLAKSFVPPLTEHDLNKKADPTPLDAPQPTRLKDLKIAPRYVDKSMAVPATPEMDVVLSKMDELEQKISVLDRAAKDILANAKEQIAKIDQAGERTQMEAEYQAAIEQTGVLINAVETKVVSWRDKILTMQNEEVQLVPKITPNQMLEKIYAKFDGAEKFVQSVLNGMMSLAKTITEKTLVRFPNRKSSLNKEASTLDVLNKINEELLAALKELSSPL